MFRHAVDSVRNMKASTRLKLAVVLLALAIAPYFLRPLLFKSASWTMLISPLEPGDMVQESYRLSPLQRGENDDVVITARRVDGGGLAEIHITDHGVWPEALKTPSFEVGYSSPPSYGPPDELSAVTHAVADAIAANDTGRLGPVAGYDLRRGETAPITRGLRAYSGVVGFLCTACLLVAGLLISSLRRGPLWLGLLLFAGGLALRAVHLDLPFTWDQDVQRLRTAAAPLGDVLTGVGLLDRRPPLYFVILHFAQYMGQNEWVVRLPAAIAGALVGPAIITAVWLARRAVGPLSALMATVATLSPIFVTRSREVSEIPLFAVVLLLLVGLTFRALSVERARLGLLAAVAGFCALTLWTYHLAVVAIVAFVLPLLYLKRLSRRVAAALTVGVVCGSPSLLLAARAFMTDLSVRQSARAHPELAWGERGIVDMLGRLFDMTASSVGLLLTILLVLALIAAVVRRNGMALSALLTVLVAAVTLALLTPVARIQPYYLVAVLPLGLLGVAAFDGRLHGKSQSAVLGAIGLSAAIFLASAGPRLSTLYVDESGAFMDTFARRIRAEGHETVVTVAGYDATLLSYELCQLEGAVLGVNAAPVEGTTLRIEGLDEVIVTLVDTHTPGPNADRDAVALLGELTDEGPVPVVIRDTVRLPELERVLAACELLDETARARLLLCR